MANQLRAHLQTTLPGAIGLFRDIDSAITLRFLTRFPSQDKADWLSRPGWGTGCAGRLQPPGQPRPLWDHLDRGSARHHRTRGRRPAADHPGPRRRADAACAPRSRPSKTRSPTSSPPIPTRRSSPRCPAPAPSAPPGSWPRSATPAAGSPPPSPDLPGRRRPLDPTVRQGQSRHLPLGRRQTTPRRRHRLRRRLPPRQPLGRRPLPSARARGHDHPHAVRILARAWLHVIWRCWQDRVPYDPAKHSALQRVLNQRA